MKYGIPAIILCGVIFPLMACATAKPCPPPPAPQVITIEKPVVQPWPEPPTFKLPTLKMPTLSASQATVQDLLLAAIHDADEWELLAKKALTALDAYRHKPPIK